MTASVPAKPIQAPPPQAETSSRADSQSAHDLRANCVRLIAGKNRGPAHRGVIPRGQAAPDRALPASEHSAHHVPEQAAGSATAAAAIMPAAAATADMMRALVTGLVRRRATGGDDPRQQ